MTNIYGINIFVEKEILYYGFYPNIKHSKLSRHLKIIGSIDYSSVHSAYIINNPSQHLEIFLIGDNITLLVGKYMLIIRIKILNDFILLAT